MKKILVFVLIVGLITLFISVINKDSWTGYFYPNKDDLSVFQKSVNTFDSVEECRRWVNSKVLKSFSNSYDYECGLNCKPGLEFDRCETTTK